MAPIDPVALPSALASMHACERARSAARRELTHTQQLKKALAVQSAHVITQDYLVLSQSLHDVRTRPAILRPRGAELRTARRGCC